MENVQQFPAIASPQPRPRFAEFDTLGNIERNAVNMASDLEFVKFAVDQVKGAGEISYRMMFGEYAVYCEGKIVALICDNQFFVKPTEAGRSFIGDVVEAPPYPGAKPSFLIGEQIEDTDWVSNLIRLTEQELPKPKPKKKRKKKIAHNK